MQVEIRPAGRADVDSITLLEAVSFDSPWRREFFENELVAPGRYNRVVLDPAGLFLGYLFSMYILDEMHVNKIAVIEEWRRKGIARALMKDSLRFALDNRIRQVSLEVRESNQGAVEFYRTLFFDTVYRRNAYYPNGEAAIVMTRVL